MSGPVLPNGRPENPSVSRDLELDVSKLHSLPSEQQDLFLLTFVADFVRHVQGLADDSLPQHQKSIKKQLVVILNLSTPIPSRPIRNNLASIYADIFSRGSRSLLFEAINELLDVINAPKGEKDPKNKHAAVVCLGRVLQAAGDSVITLCGLSITSLLKLLKQSQVHVGARAAIYKALSLAVKGFGPSVDEQYARDIWKSAKGAISNEKAYLPQRYACQCLEILITVTSFFGNASDHDSLKLTAWRAFESPVTVVRHAAASALASAFVKSFSDHEGLLTGTKQKQVKASKNAKTGLNGLDEADRPNIAASKKPNPALALSLIDILDALASQYTKSSTNNRGRAGLVICYRYTLLRLPSSVVEESYSLIASHLFHNLLNNPHVLQDRYRLLLTRRLVKAILDVTVGVKILTESAQVNAVRWLLNDVLRNYPQSLAERPEPPKQVIIAALSSLSSLLGCLGPAVGPVVELCRETLLQVLQHPSYTVQVHVCHCLRMFAFAFPQQILPCAQSCMESMKKNLARLNDNRLFQRRSTGYATAVATLVSSSRSQPLYGSVEVFSQVLNTATELLKASSSAELRVSATQVQVAWILICGLMSLGPNFVKIHLPQLLLLWKNALPKHLSQDNSAKRGPLELSFLAHVRECALSALFVFLEYNGSLITTDGSKRLAMMLQNTISFTESIARRRHVENVSDRLITTLQLQDFLIMVQRRVLQCYTRLLSFEHLAGAGTALHSNLLSLAISSLADPESSSNQNVSSISISAITFENLWGLADNWGFGVTGYATGYHIEVLGKTGARKQLGSLHSADEDKGIDDIFSSPSCKGLEHDTLHLYLHQSDQSWPEADPPATQVVNAAIDLFAVALPLQPLKVQESSLEHLAMLLVRPYTREPGRKAALRTNILIALLNSLVVSNRETTFASGKIAASSAEKIAIDLIQDVVMDPDPFIRSIGIEITGRICNIAGSQATNSQVRRLIDLIIANRDPNVRAGCSMALGCIHDQVGGMAAGFHLKTIVGVLLSLCNDPHPIVHFWALQALNKVADSAGLSFSSYVGSTLGVLARLYSNDSHTEEVMSLATSNLEVEFSSPVLITKCVDSLINVLGPDLQDMKKERELIESLVEFFRHEDSIHLVIEGSICSGHLSLYNPGHLDFSDYVRQLQKGLLSSEERIREISIDSLNDLVKRDAESLFSAAGSSLEEDLWIVLDQNPDHTGIQDVMRNWLRQTYEEHTADWIERCQNVLSKTRTKPEKLPKKLDKAPTLPDLQDEEVAGFAAAAAVAQGDESEGNVDGQEFLKWQTRSFAMSCLSEVVLLISKSVVPDQTTPAEADLKAKIGDVIRMAFSASTANVVQLRAWGLRIIDQILKLFGKTPDPDFIEASLLEQYQAQISSALTPAFAPDSSPGLASEAINVCATFVATGIVTSVERMGRIFKLLVAGLENISELSKEFTIGEMKLTSTNAQIMLKLSLLSAWAQLQVSSTEQPYLEAIVRPYIRKLTPLWLASLQDFARLRFEPDISSSLGGSGSDHNLNELYAAFNRETLLHFYQDTWLNSFEAVAMLIDKGSRFVFDALDNRDSHPTDQAEDASGAQSENVSQKEPTAFFFILYGLAFESLVSQARDDPRQTLKVLEATRKILRPAISGSAIYTDAVFDETMEILDRLGLTEGVGVQIALVGITRSLALDHQATRHCENGGEDLDAEIQQLFELTRVMILILARVIPTLDQSQVRRPQSLGEEYVALIRSALEALVDVSNVFPSVIRSDLHACIVHIFCCVLASGNCQATVVPLIFPTFRRFLQTISTSLSSANLRRLARGCLWQFLRILGNAQRRENEYSLACAKNTLLGITILITTMSSTLAANDILIHEALDATLDCLEDIGLATVATNCLRSLLLSNPKVPADEAIFRHLFPRLLHFLVDPSTDDPENARTIVARMLASSVKSVPKASRPALCALVIPALLKRAALDGQAVHKQTAALLLDIVGADQVGFRDIFGRLEGPERDLMGMIMNTARSRERGISLGGEEEDAKPTIELRMDF